MFIMECFPECFPDNFTIELNKIEVEVDEKDVYRVSDNGVNNKAAFKSTYEKFIDGEITDKDLDNEDYLTNFSTSCSTKMNKIKGILKCCLKRDPKACMLSGRAVKVCGPSQLTSVRTRKHNNGHLDWWLFKDSQPSKYFSIVEES